MFPEVKLQRHNLLDVVLREAAVLIEKFIFSTQASPCLLDLAVFKRKDVILMPLGLRYLLSLSLDDSQPCGGNLRSKRFICYA